ncbi:Tmk Thymidylate kinase [uncultured Caudovirales phage]|uniref:Tmk Thymidylate kinase n=1 Tax=uncultured Caudovirales phage TaxID=2100421 RepID=A0A6J5QJ01_9CAUD|nr:Tmk Thymidylate kinase [uncultured Caudovirales phage]
MKPKLIILEGADGVGKSTLGKFLAQYFNGVYFHCTATKLLIPAMHDYQQNVLENVTDNICLGRTVILDRFWISEMIYGGVLRPNNPHGFSWQHFASECRDLDPIYVICSCESAIQRHVEHKDPAHPYEDSTYDKIFREYKAHWDVNKNTPNYMLYDMDHQGACLDRVGRQIYAKFNDYFKAKHVR